LDVTYFKAQYGFQLWEPRKLVPQS